MTQKATALHSRKRDLTLITTHVNADYDALASMLAAAKLYPDALLVLPGSQERNLRNFFVESTCYLYNFVKVKNVPLDRIARLVLVDTRQADRIGTLSQLLEVPGLTVHAYDHHPDSEDDVKTDYQVVEPVGAAVTVLTEILQKKGADLTDDEATILALGIYEDTGNFTFSSTTPRDFEAASWLLQKGANLNVVSNLITRELTPEEVGALNDMIKAAVKFKASGAEVVVSEVSCERYIPEFAVLVHKFMDMENLDALFVVARMEGRLYLMARSRIAQIDVGRIAKAMGGGGHPTAASATLREMTLVEARERLAALLHVHINAAVKARDLMTAPVITVTPVTTVEEAHQKLSRYGLNVLVVARGNEIMGLIGTEILDRALHHGLGKIEVSEYMERNVEPLDGDVGLDQVEEAVMGYSQRLVPIMVQGRLAGVITRTDLLNHLIENPHIPEYQPEPGQDQGKLRRKQVKGLMRERIPREILEVLKTVGLTAQEAGYKVYLVGGSVRDLFLRSPNLDLDLVVEGNGMDLAKKLARRLGKVRVRTHKKFQTAKLIFDDGLIIDVATARMEYYKSPAALPVIELSSLKMDLYRRDFTINTLAVSLNPKDFGLILDFFDGLRDLKGKVIRVLHNLSFVEDPTRVFRAVRFEQRFNFRIGKFTEGLIKNALKIDAFKLLTGDRLFHELENMLLEEKATDCMRRLGELNLLEVYHPKLKLSDKLEAILDSVEQVMAWYKLSFLTLPTRPWLVYFLALADPLDEAEMEQLCARLALAPRLRREIKEMRAQTLKVLNRLQRNQLSPSKVYDLLHKLKPAYQLYIMAKARQEWAKKAVSRYLGNMTKVKPLLTGDDLAGMGFDPGPLFKEILERVLAARLDGEVTTKEDELALVKSEFGSYLEKTV
ncbi:CBS domain-containing protein [Dethiosulfatarculus sandiegensis]|uniref:PolyA polymerase n=1 Tax=Dethiosulfatarculus sandiegensis TaxID=1429043 RepID=A0A0D2J8R2_9BACT|nr:CBS domain-containing protein [Dethiosulfatarculus sandiegensis]KIX12111.1 polyA polymerase [Dethiosulfatarculus sandiegensis]